MKMTKMDPGRKEYKVRMNQSPVAAFSRTRLPHNRRFNAPYRLNTSTRQSFENLSSHTGQVLVGGDVDDFELLGVKCRIAAE
jgi:hypothetical protein